MGDEEQITEDPLGSSESVQSIKIGVHRPKKGSLYTTIDINLDKYRDIPVDQIYLDPKPRIKNVVKELEEEHDWAWPPPLSKDVEKARISKRQKCPMLYSRECLLICTIVSALLGPFELLVAIGFMIIPKTFIPAMRESSEFCILFVVIFLLQGFYHIYAAILGCGLRPIKPQNIGFAFPSGPLEFIMPLLGIFATFISFYTTQRWRILQEMRTHLTGYSYRWFSKTNWDHYQSFMFCCGIDNYTDWKMLGPVLVEPNGSIIDVPQSCCTEDNCWQQVTDSNVYNLGCLDMTIMGTNAIFGCAVICMLVAFVLAIVGYRSMREAEDYIGDPVHALLFDLTSSSTLRRRNRALRREELFNLLNSYALMYGEELGLYDEVFAARNYLTGDDTATLQDDVGVGSSQASLEVEVEEGSSLDVSSSDTSGPRIGSTTDLILEKFSPRRDNQPKPPGSTHDAAHAEDITPSAPPLPSQTEEDHDDNAEDNHPQDIENHHQHTEDTHPLTEDHTQHDNQSE